MASPYRELAQREAREAQRLALAAAHEAAGAIGATLAHAATAALASVQRDDGRGTIVEPAADLSQLRHDPTLVAAKRADLGRAQAMAERLVVGAVRAGYEDDARGRAAVLVAKSTGLRIAVTVSAEEATALADFPVVGFTPRELAARLAYQLDQAIDQALALPLSGLLDARTLPAALGEVGRLHGERLAAAVREAYFAGTRAASRAILAALAGG